MDDKSKFYFQAISDLGFCRPPNKTEDPRGVLGFMVPEHLRGD